MRTRAVLFDLDCTLTCRRRSIERFVPIFLDAFPACAQECSPDQWAVRIGDADGFGYTPREQFIERVLLNGGREPAVPVAEALACWQAHFPRCSVENDGALTTLKALKDAGFSLGVVTNGRTTAQEAKIDALGLRPMLSAVVISEAAGVKKPDPRIFLRATETLVVDPGETVFVGDHPHNDIAGATEAGLRAVWVRGSHDWPAELPVPPQSVGGLAELLPMLGCPAPHVP